MKKASLFLFIMIISLIPSGCRNDFDDNKENQAIGNFIIAALDDYQEQNNGEYPSSLDDLVPNYLTSLPETVRGEEFEYFPDKLEGYYLCFGPWSNDKYGCCYNKWFDSQFDSWDCTDGD